MMATKWSSTDSVGILVLFLAAEADSTPSSPTTTEEETIITTQRRISRAERRERVSEEYHKMEVDLSLKVKKEISVRECKWFIWL